jgi:hypothetical protein
VAHGAFCVARGAICLALGAFCVALGASSEAAIGSATSRYVVYCARAAVFADAATIEPSGCTRGPIAFLKSAKNPDVPVKGVVQCDDGRSTYGIPAVIVHIEGRAQWKRV